MISYVYDLAKKITSSFEGSGYDQITGNIDGQYMSVGLLQWNFGQGTLQPLLNRLFNEFPEIPQKYMPEGGKWLKRALAEGWEREWALQTQIKNQVVDPWLTALKNVCNTAEFQKIQDDAIEDYESIAFSMCDAFDLKTDRAYCLFFDIAVQNGSLKYFDIPETEYKKKLEAIATAAVLKSKVEWRENVRSRKKCIVDGYGYVHGKYYVLPFTDEDAIASYKFRYEMLKKDLQNLLNSQEMM
jgi:hypothetical protein